MAAAIFLLTGLTAQSQEVFVCHLTGDKPQLVYYCNPPIVTDCEMGGGWEPLNVQAIADRCKMSAAKLPSLQAAPFPISSHLRVTLLDGPQPPPGILPAIPSDFAFSKQILTYSERFSLPFWLPGTRTYLLTHRLRN